MRHLGGRTDRRLPTSSPNPVCGKLSKQAILRGFELACRWQPPEPISTWRGRPDESKAAEENFRRDR